MIVATRLIRDRRWSMLWWALGFAGLTLFTVALYPSIKGQPSVDELLADFPDAFRTVIGYDAAVPLSSPAGHLHARLFAALAPLLAVVFGIGAGARATGGSEEAGTLEPLLANPITRDREFGTLAFSVGAATGRRGPAVATATSLAVAGYLVESVLATTGGLRMLRLLSPWHW